MGTLVKKCAWIALNIPWGVLTNRNCTNQHHVSRDMKRGFLMLPYRNLSRLNASLSHLWLCMERASVFSFHLFCFVLSFQLKHRSVSNHWCNFQVDPIKRRLLVSWLKILGPLQKKSRHPEVKFSRSDRSHTVVALLRKRRKQIQTGQLVFNDICTQTFQYYNT